MISKLDQSVFANVDLDLYSSHDLLPIVDAFGNKVIEMWVGRVRRTYEAHLEIGWSKKQNPTSIILRFYRLVESLKSSDQKLWDAAKTKSSDVGIHAPARNHHYRSAVSPEAIRATARIGAQIAFTIYGPMKPDRPQQTLAGQNLHADPCL